MSMFILYSFDNKHEKLNQMQIIIIYHFHEICVGKMVFCNNNQTSRNISNKDRKYFPKLKDKNKNNMSCLVKEKMYLIIVLLKITKRIQITAIDNFNDTHVREKKFPG